MPRPGSYLLMKLPVDRYQRVRVRPLIDPAVIDESVRFEGFRLDSRRGLFRVSEAGGEEPVAIGSRALNLLLVLAERHGEVVPKNTIMQRVWPGVHVDQSNLTVQISALRRLLDGECAQCSYIQTVPGRGYRLTAAVSRSNRSSCCPPALALPQKPSIAVLPFANLSGDPAQQYFADGMVDEIITAPSRIRWLFVIARNSSFSYKDQDIDPKLIGSSLGVRYLLQGSVRKAGNRVRITAQLIESSTATHIWAEHFNGSLEDVFDLQEIVALTVAGIIEPALQAAEIHRSCRLPTEDDRIRPLSPSTPALGIMGTLARHERPRSAQTSNPTRSRIRSGACDKRMAPSGN